MIIRDGPECAGVPVNQPQSDPLPRRNRPSKATLVVTRPLGATLGRGAAGCWATSGAAKTAARTAARDVDRTMDRIMDRRMDREGPRRYFRSSSEARR